jgi:hypothetical protein
MVKKSEFMSNVNMIARNMLQKAGLTFSGKRDLYEVLGYKEFLCPADYRARYERGDITLSIVDAYPNAAWACPPTPSDDKEAEDETPWEKEFKVWAKELKLWQTIRKADILAQLNEFSIVLFGIRGDNDLKEPVIGKKPIAYLKAYGADNVTICKWVTDMSDERFGLPLTYKIQFVSKPGEGVREAIEVHHSRVLHIAERTMESEVVGIPFLKPIWNTLDDLDKIRGGSAEVFWLNARAGLNLNVSPEFDVPDQESIKDNVDNYQNNLTRVLYTQGIDVKVLSQAITSPKDQFNLCLTIISAYTRIPRRILEGSERGELSSKQDENNFDSRVKERRTLFCEPTILEPLMKKLMNLGVIKTVEYIWSWPELVTQSESEKAAIASTKATAIKTFTDAVNGNRVVTDRQFMEDIMNMPYLEDEIIEDLETEQKEIDESGPDQYNNPPA